MKTIEQQNTKHLQKMKKLNDQDYYITQLLSVSQSLPENAIVDTLLLESLSDSESQSEQLQDLDKGMDEDDENEDNQSYDSYYQNLIDSGNDALMNMVRRLQEEEAQLDYAEQLRITELKQRDEKAKQLVENDNSEEAKLNSEIKLQDWTDEVANDLSENFRQKCMSRLKSNNNLTWISYSDRFPNAKTIKNMLTIKLPSKAWIEHYYIQECERYKNPSKPWIYYNPDGTTCIVSPVIKKVGQATSKARDHNALKKDRPPVVTVLCLVRDAAARLPDGVGTRADI